MGSENRLQLGIMISKFGREIFRLKLLSVLGTFLPLVLLQLSLLLTSVGSYNTASYGDGSNSNGYSSLCRVVRDTRKDILASFKAQYTASSSQCDLSNHCANVTCSAEFSRSKVNAGIVFRLCEDDPKVDYWVDLPGQWNESWVHSFSSEKLNGQMQRVEIIGNHNASAKETKSTRWFIKVAFSISSGRLQINTASKHISIQSVLQICQNEMESSCTNTTLLDFPRLPQNQICYFDDESSPQEDSESFIGSSSRSSRNANAWDPQKLHLMAAERAKKFENGRPLPASPGDNCDSSDIFGCGPGGTCVINPSGPGICRCLTGYTLNKVSGRCSVIPQAPASANTSEQEDNSRSYSSAIGAIVSILILVTVAAGVYFGTKYHYFSRFRHRIPVLRCWPFRRHQPWEDNVTMVERF